MDDMKGRKTENVVIVAVNLDDLSTNIKSVIPVKPFEGKKRDNTLKYLLAYLIGRILPVNDVREVIQEDFLSYIKIRKYHKLTM
jgi:hypothetical protein